MPPGRPMMVHKSRGIKGGFDSTLDRHRCEQRASPILKAHCTSHLIALSISLKKKPMTARAGRWMMDDGLMDDR